MDKNKRLHKFSAKRGKLLAEIIQKWVDRLGVKKPLDHGQISEHVNWLYQFIDFFKYRNPPEIIIAESPRACLFSAHKIRELHHSTEDKWFNLGPARFRSLFIQGLNLSPPEYGDNGFMTPWLRLLHRSICPQFASNSVGRRVFEQARLLVPIAKDVERMIHNDHHGNEEFSPDGIAGSAWGIYYEFFRVCGIVSSDLLDRHLDFIQNSGIFMSIYLGTTVIACPNPSKIALNANYRLHCSDGPAIAWDDGFELYFLNGVVVDRNLVMLKPHEIDPMLVLKVNNTEVRREIIRKIGIERIVQATGAHVLDRWGDYELIELNIPGMQSKPRYLKMRNPSIGVWHLEGVPPGIRTCCQALGWRDGEVNEEGDGIYTIPKELT